MKRAFDFFVASVALVLFSPLIVILAALVLATMGQPIFFVQIRPGLHGRPFPMIKFRTMRTEGRADLTDQHRLTALGRKLRATSLDELPEFWNVVKGDMSLVGPRPLLMEYLPLYSAAQMRRHEVRPGMTGWAQVNGRNAVSWPQRFALDIWYVENRAFLLDLRILALTVRTLFRREGISAEGHATMPRFTGERGDFS